jgi:hypothetical protein
MFAGWYDYNTHCVICGTAGSGKSKFCELCIREKIRDGHGVTLFDWHGTLFKDLIPYMATMEPDVPVYLLNPSDPMAHGILPYDPFALTGGDLSAHVTRTSETIAKIWNASFDETPTLESKLATLLAAKCAMNESLRHANMLYFYPKKELRERAIELMAADGSGDYDEYRQELAELQYQSSMKEFMDKVLSTRNRIARLVRSKSIRLFTGLGEAFSAKRAIAENAITLVNLKPSQWLPETAAKVYAAMILSDFLQAALDNNESPIPHFLYCDEANNYLTDDAAKLLDQSRKSGLRVTIIHHYPGQFRKHPDIIDSLKMNAQSKVVFAGLPYKEAIEMAEEFFPNEINELLPKQEIFRTVTEFMEEPIESTTETSGSYEDHSGGGSSEGHSIVHGSRLAPFQTREFDHYEFYSLPEKTALKAALFLNLTEAECWIKLPFYKKNPATVRRYNVPFVRPFLPDAEDFVGFMGNLLGKPPYIPFHEAERILKEKETAFLERTHEYENVGTKPGRPKKKTPPHLHPQS